MKFTGLILDGAAIAGFFRYFTAEDCYGKRELNNVALLSNYFDVVKNRSNKQLKFVYAEIDGKNYKVIDELGKGFITCQHIWADTDRVILGKAIFNKEPNTNIN